MSAPVVLGGDLDILPTDIPVRVFVLDSEIWEMHLIIEVGQVVLARPFPNLLHRPIRPAVAVASASIALLQEALVLTLQLAVQGDPEDARIAPTQAISRVQIRPIHLGIVRALARPVGAGIEPLAVFGVPCPTAFEKAAATVCEGDGSLTSIQWHALDESLLLEVAEVSVTHVERGIARVA